MEFKIPFYSRTSSDPCGGSDVDLSASVQLKLTNKHITVIDDGAGGYIDLASISVDPTVVVCITNNNDAVEVTYYRELGITEDYLHLSFTLLNVWDSIDLTLDVTNGRTFIDYLGTLKIFGYNYGTGATTIPIYLSYRWHSLIPPVPYYLPFASLYFQQEPYTGKLYIQNTSSYKYDSFNIYDDETGILLGDISDIYICLTEDTTLRLVSQNGTYTCTKETDVTWLTFLPVLNTGLPCEDCDSTCLTPEGTSVEVAIDFTNMNNVFENTDEVVPGSLFDNGGDMWALHLNIVLTVTDLDGNVTYSDNKLIHAILDTGDFTILDNLGTTLSITRLVTLQFDNITVPTKGDYVVNVCQQVIGNEQEFILDGQIPNAYYKVYFEGVDLTTAATAGDVEFIRGTGDASNPELGDIIQVEASSGYITADSWNHGKLVQVYLYDNSRSPVAIYPNEDVFIKPKVVDTATLEGTGLVENFVVNYLPDMVLDYDESDVELVLVDWVVSCCEGSVVSGCDTYDVTRNACGTFTIVNNSATKVTMTIYNYVDGEWTEYVEEDIAANTSEELILTEDGIYKFVLGETIFYRIVYCNMEACKLRYLKALMCCNSETNCSDCHDDDCSKKNFYNFNAFSILYNTFWVLMNNIEEFSYVYNDENEVLENVYQMDKVLERALEYCLECNTPCLNC